MVLYNSPYAVALLVGAMLFVSIGALSMHFRLYRATAHVRHVGPAPGNWARLEARARTLQRRLLSSVIGVLSAILFWVLLGTLTFRQAFHTPSPVYIPAIEVSWSPATRPTPVRSFDRLDYPASSSDHFRHR